MVEIILHSKSLQLAQMYVQKVNRYEKVNKKKSLFCVTKSTFLHSLKLMTILIAVGLSLSIIKIRKKRNGWNHDKCGKALRNIFIVRKE